MRRNWILWAATCLHIAWAALLILDPSTSLVTPLAAIVQPIGRHPTAAILIISSAMSVVGVLPHERPGILGVGMVLPQQFLLMVSATGSLTAILTGAVPSGSVFPFGQLWAGQIWAIALAVWHSIAILDYLAFRGGFPWTRP